MDRNTLSGCRVLIAEDEFFLASDTARLLKGAGATVVGPIGTLAHVEEQVRSDGFDAALLDIRLDRELIWPAADMIRQSGVPLALLTGYDDTAVSERFSAVPLCQKPCPDEALIGIVQSLCSSPST